jgi:diaminopimelate epimerase
MFLWRQHNTLGGSNVTKNLIRFTKLAGAGNDFVLFDGLGQELPNDLSGFAKSVCARRLGIGADGVVIVVSTDGGLVHLRVINPDGSEASTCGNAIRCSAYYCIRHLGIKGPSISMGGYVYIVRVTNEAIATSFDIPRHYEGPIEINHEIVYYVYAGTEHIVCFVQNVDLVDIEDRGRAYRFHLKFAPRGTNVNFVQIVDSSSIKVRTYERGIEAETLSCGSGAVAATLVSYNLGLVTSHQVEVQNRTHTPLRVSFDGEAMPFSEIWLAGPVSEVFKGEI